MRTIEELTEENGHLRQRQNIVIKWCKANIESKSQVSNFAVQVRDVLEDSTLLECTACGMQGYYPHGKSGQLEIVNLTGD